MRSRLSIAALVPLVILVQGCDQLPGQAASAAANEKIAALEKEAAYLKYRLEIISTEVLTLRSDFTQHAVIGKAVPASVNCAEEGYASARTDDGFVFLVSCEDASSYLKGTRVRLQIGNPYFANHQLGYTVRYQRPGAESMSEVTGKLTNAVQSGSWSKLSLVFNDVKPDELTRFTVEFDADLIELIQRR